MADTSVAREPPCNVAREPHFVLDVTAPIGALLPTAKGFEVHVHVNEVPVTTG